ncbi:MAG: sodium/substrate symporter small subunit [Planctomycetota bacterium JB042]
MTDEPIDRCRTFWRASLRLLALLLSVWAIAGFGLSIVLVERLNEIRWFGFPLGFWFAQQGAIVIFVLLVLVNAVVMDRLEARHRAGERGDG